MVVSNVSGPGSSPGFPISENASDSQTELGRDAFLQLLVAQLEHQDPLSPMENADFTAQLAQFSSLEEMETMNANLMALVASQTAANSVQAAGLIGKEVQAQSSAIQVREGESSTLRYMLAGDSAKVTINIFNNAGNLVQTLELTDQQAGEQEVPWNDTDAQGDPLPDGEYYFVVTASDSTGNPVLTTTFVQGRVQGVEYEANRTFLVMEGSRVDLAAVVSVHEEEG